MASIRDVWLHANRILRAAKQITGTELKQLDLSGVEGSVLLHLSVQGEHLNQDQLAEQLDYDKAVISRALNELEHLGYVARKRRADDRRAYTLSLTDSALDVMPQVEQIFNRLYARVLDSMPEGDIEELVRLLTRISDSLAMA